MVDDIEGEKRYEGSCTNYADVKSVFFAPFPCQQLVGTKLLSRSTRSDPLSPYQVSNLNIFTESNFQVGDATEFRYPNFLTLLFYKVAIINVSYTQPLNVFLGEMSSVHYNW